MRQLQTSVFGRSVHVRAFAWQLGILLAIFTTAVFIGIYARSHVLAERAVYEQATSYIDLVVATREWNSSYGGVWVQMRDGVQENPYLRLLGVDPSTSTVSGQRLTLRNPAAMTAELSAIVNSRDAVTFRLTSLRPVNPNDTPDDWERDQLSRFESDATTSTRVERTSNGRRLRMMRPLMTEPSCLRCHAAQGYRVGDVRGAISVTVPLNDVDKRLRRDAWTLFGLWTLIMAGIGGTVYSLVYRMALQVVESEDRLRRAATTDVLTGLPNRGAVIGRLTEELARSHREGSTLGVLTLDIDHFKLVNDRLGHAAGDVALDQTARRLENALRPYDMVGRIGGEEFLVVAPDIDEIGIHVLGERLRESIEARPIEHGQHHFGISISVGGTLARATESPESVMARADGALYAAKAAGRNRVDIA